MINKGFLSDTFDRLRVATGIPAEILKRCQAELVEAIITKG